MSESTELLAASQRGLAPGLNSQGSLTSSQELGPSRLNSKRAHSASEDEDEESDEEDLGFGDSDYFKDTKYGMWCITTPNMVDLAVTKWSWFSGF